MKQAAARGVLPVSREELIEILVFLADDPDPVVAEAARNSLADFPEDALIPLLQSAFTATAVLQFFSRPPFRSRELLDQVILNTATPDEAIAALSDQVDAPQIEAILINLMRLLRCPAILEALERNPQNTSDTRRRFGEIRAEFFEKRNTFVPVSPFSASEMLGETAVTPSGDGVEPEEFHPLVTVDSPDAVVDATVHLLEQDGEEIHAERVTTLQKIARMTVAERVQLALKGSRDERLILVRDANKVVGRAVLQSPKITENEVEWIAQMRNVNEEVLRLVGTARAWAKNYSVIHNLVKNSRAPIAVTLPLLNRILIRDLKTLARNKNIPEVIRKNAQRMAATREQGRN